MSNEWVTTEMREWMELCARNSVEGLDSDETVSLTYTQVTAKSLDTATMQVTETKTATAVTAWRPKLLGKPGQFGEQAGELVFIIEQRRLAAIAGFTEPSADDRVTEGPDTYRVDRWRPDAGRLRWTLFCKKVRT